jgi:hypothetical protein
MWTAIGYINAFRIKSIITVLTIISVILANILSLEPKKIGVKTENDELLTTAFENPDQTTAVVVMNEKDE